MAVWVFFYALKVNCTLLVITCIGIAVWDAYCKNQNQTLFKCSVFPSLKWHNNCLVTLLWGFIFNPHPRIYLLFFVCSFKREKGGRERERERETWIWCFTYPCIHWLSPLCTWTGDGTCNLGLCSDQGSTPQPFWCTGWRPNQLSHPASASVRI